jgi:hypothetical protein
MQRQRPREPEMTAQTSFAAGPLHVPIVPMSVKVPVARSMLYMETLFEPEFVT